MSGVSQVSSYGTALSSGTSTSNSELGKEQFLQLLVTQLQYQDPLNPMEDQEFIAQMAQFSSLEQLVNLNTSMEGLTEATKSQEMFNSANYIGKYVSAVGNVIGKTTTMSEDGTEVVSTEVSPLYYRFNNATAKGTITVYDSNNNVVYTESLDAQDSSSTYKFQWDGKNNAGESMPDGSYTVSVTGYDSAGESVLCTPMVCEKVTDILRDGDSIYLRLSGSQLLAVDDVELVSVERPAISDDEKEADKGGSTGSGSDTGTEDEGTEGSEESGSESETGGSETA